MRHREQHLRHSTEEDELDLSIIGDEEEQHRIQLENNLQDISIQLSVTNPSQNSVHDQCDTQSHDDLEERQTSYSLEYARHNSNPHDVSIFHGRNSSLIDHSHMDNEYESHPYSYHTVEEDEGINPYGGDTISTAAHHASALTLNAGLGGRSGKRVHGCDVSLSGAEYDPDRPLETMINGIVKDMSMFEINSVRKKTKRRSNNPAPQVTFDPVIIDNTPNLNHFHIPNRPRVTPTCVSDLQVSVSSHSVSEPDTPDAEYGPVPHTILGDALNRVSGTFSPKRPRPAQSHQSASEPTPKVKPHLRQPTVNVQPPTPSTAGSKFTKMAKGLAKEIEASQRWVTDATREMEGRTPIYPSTKPCKNKSRTTERNPFHDVINHAEPRNVVPVPSVTKANPRRSIPSTASISKAGLREVRNLTDKSRTKEKVQLPDVTGLTSAVGSPIKRTTDCWAYSAGNVDDGREAAYLLQTLTNLQTRLNQLESQNLVSRRRVRELEMELESCKADVKRERTRVLEREEIIVAQQREADIRKKGKGKAVQMDESMVDSSRYQEVVEEKKALEALITSLRTHLTRLTAELSSHQALITELRSLRDSDVHAVQEKMADVDRIKLEVERLGSEVEVLRGVIEEGLNERRRVKDSLDNSAVAQTHFLPQVDVPAEDDHRQSGDDAHQELLSQPRSRFKDKTIRADRPIGLFGLVEGKGRRYIEEEELQHVSAELEERRSERSNSVLSHTGIASDSPTRGGPSSKRIDDLHKQPSQGVHVEHRSPRPVGPTVPRTSSQSHSRPQLPAQNTAPETPFPQIRGDRLERMFFSAPEHNTKTCRVCHRRRRPSSPNTTEVNTPSWLPLHRHNQAKPHEVLADDEDEGFEEGSGDASPKNGTKGKERVTFAVDNRLPPQTVLARVVRELEDDFTHYKGIYVELADQYKIMDAASNVPKRNVLAQHLKDVINTLEQKGDQIASLYDLLTYKDKPIPESVVHNKGATQHSHSPPLVS